ncbi:MAG: VirB4 family type IV secretion/conjugal transfer ATPase [Candidatus Accumulibacter sp.]|jgi:type IV secretion/conjugal transfer VirB4 family ATPase|nr:VirB4 family type IV secretion/conjugal transfer ATPase [Accumulibacter sp.]
MSALPKYFEQMRNERSVSSFIPYSSHITKNTLITLDGDFVRIWKVGGIAHEGIDADEIEIRKDQLNTLYRGIGSPHVAIWTHNVRRQTSDRLLSNFENDFCRELDKKYYDSFAGYRMMANELYFTLVYRPNISRIDKALIKAGRRSIDEIKDEHRQSIRKLDDLSIQIEASMSRYDIEPLTAYTDDKGARCSQMLEFLNFLISGTWQKVRVPTCPIHDYIGTSWIFAGTETIEIRAPSRTRYAQCLDFKDYTDHTEPGLLNSLMYQQYEYVITQSFSFFSKNDGKTYLERQKTRLMNTEDGSLTQIEEMTQAIDELIRGDFNMGEYHYSLMIFGDTIEEVRRNVGSAVAIVQDLGFITSIVSTATDAAFYAQLPGNWFYRPRVAGLTSRNFAGLASFHNFAAGKRDGNPWGPAVTLFKTPSMQPYYFNFHASKEDDDAYDQKLLGNTCVIGQAGSGKTVLLGMLLCQSQKFKPTSPTGYSSVFFDKDRGAEIAIRAMGGKYLALENGKPTGFNPFQMEPAEDNILFLEQLVRKLVSGEGQRVTTADDARISHAVRTVMRMPEKIRQLSVVLQNITEGVDKEDRENSVAKRLARWCADDGHGKRGPFWWVFDNPADQLDFTTHTIYGFDGTAFLDNAQVRTPMAMYLLHRMDGIIDGRRFQYFMDEFWKWLLDDAFSDFAFNKQKTIRKQNGLGCFATQSPADVLKSDISRAIVEGCATEIYLPNPRADHGDYVDGFKLTEAEYGIVRMFNEDSRTFLVKQGHHSAIVKLDLAGFGDELAILSGSTDNVALLDTIMAEVGEDPKVWLPIFHERRKARRDQAKPEETL